MEREHIPDAVVGSVPGLEIRHGAGISSASEGGQSAHSLALTSLSSRRLRGIPVAQKVGAKQWRYLDKGGNVVTRAEAMSLAGGVIYYQDATDPSRGQLRQSGRFVSEDQARTVAGSDCDTHDGYLTGIDEDAEYEDAEVGKGGDGGNDDEEEEEGAQHECIETNGIPVAQKVDAKQFRYLDRGGNVVTRAEAMSLAGGVIYYQDATDPSKGQLRQSGRFVSEDHARTVAGSDSDTHDGYLTGIDEDEEYGDAEGGKGDDGDDDEDEEEEEHECVGTKGGEPTRPRQMRKKTGHVGLPLLLTALALPAAMAMLS